MATRCGRSGCGRFVGSGAALCRVHAGEEGGARPAAGRRPARQSRNRSGVAKALTAEAATALATADPGLRAEIGMIRLALARLLDDDLDAGRFSQAVARLAAVAVQVVQAQRILTAGEAQAAVERMLADLDVANRVAADRAAEDERG